jgi:hydrogenase nickel incorporation protein HypA/HybF
MHEFSIVQNIIDIVTATAKSHDVEHVHAVEVQVGKASGVVREAMEFAWEAAVKGTLLDHALLKIEEIPLLVKCSVCERKYQPAEVYDACPGCGECSPEIISGKELRVVAIET